MQIEIIPEVGDLYNIKKSTFYFTNLHGGTGDSSGRFEEKYTGPTPIVEITKVWYDDEVGYRCWAKAVNPELIYYLEMNAHPNDKRIFVSQWEIGII